MNKREARRRVAAKKAKEAVVGLHIPTPPLAHTVWASYVEASELGWTWRALEALYSEPHRAYHNLIHVNACLELAAEIVGLRAVSLALLWHDVVYVPGDKRNEELSARLLRSLQPVCVVDDRTMDEACNAILATRDHETVADNPVSQHVIDIDLSILGSRPAEYDEYVRAIRREYAAVSDEAWRVGRAGFLAKMLARKRIFHTGWGRERFEEAARANMARERP